MKKKQLFGLVMVVWLSGASLYAGLIEDVLGGTDRRAGVCAVIGGDGQLAVSVAQKTRFTVYARAKDAASLSAAMERAEKENLLGSRCYFAYGKLEVVPFPDNYVDLLVVDSSVSLAEKELLRALSPDGKILWVDGEKVVRETSKPFPKEMDQWGHWFRDPGNNLASDDTLLKWPLLSNWMGLPYEGPTPTILLVSDGRVFSITGPGLKANAYLGSPEKEEYADVVIARSVFNGEELWRHKLPAGYFTIRSCAVATKDIFYVTEGEKVVCLNSLTGEKIKEITLEGLPGDLKWIVIEDGVLFAMVGEKDPDAKVLQFRYTQPHEGQGKKIWGFGSGVAAYDLQSEKTLWTYQNDAEFDSRSIGLSNGKLVAFAPGANIVCLDTSTGKVLWKKEDAELIQSLKRAVWSKPYGNNVLRSKAVDMLCTPDAIYFNPIFSTSLYAFHPETGDILWSKTEKRLKAVYKFLIGSELYTQEKRYDALSGAETGDGCGSDGCGPTTASPSGFYGRSGIFFDRQTEKKIRDHSFRSSCYQSSFAANGLLINPMYWCGCSYILRGHTTLCSAGDFDFDQTATDLDRLETVSALSSSTPADSKDWITYRGGAKRAGASEVAVAGGITKKWETVSSEQISTPAIAVGERVFWADSLGTVHCRKNGKQAWTYSTGGKIFAAPTFWEGRLYAGSSDGYVYALNAETGALLWRFRATPEERNIMVYGHLSSTWPVNTGILVNKGVAYFAAGIVDRDSTYVFALDATTGKIRWQNNSCGWVDKENRKGVSAQGCMTLQNGYLYLAGGNAISPACFNLKTGELIVSGYQSYSAYAPIRRGRDIVAFGDDLLLAGGPLMYSPLSEENPLKPGKGTAIGFIQVKPDGTISYPEVELTATFHAPVWDDELFVLEFKDKNGQGVSAYAPEKVDDLISEIIEENKIIEWTGMRPKNYIGGKVKSTRKTFLPDETLWKLPNVNVLGMALSANALVYTCEEKEGTFALCAVSRTDGTQLWTQPLSAQPLYNSVCITRNGDIVVGTMDGKTLCFGL